MSLVSIVGRIRGRLRRAASRHLVKRLIEVRTSVPLISFSFDDFPRSAWLTGGVVLRRYRATGTYYAALGLMGKEVPAGKVFLSGDLLELVAQGHELGCHTYGHLNAWQAAPGEFQESIIENRRALAKLLPNASFKTLSYPIDTPYPGNKRVAEQHFSCCRGGGQTLNSGWIDLNLVKAHFLEQSRGDLEEPRRLIERNRQEKGWLVFATHDVSASPTHLGCDPQFFEQVVRMAVESGARILPVGEACSLLVGALCDPSVQPSPKH